MSVAVVTVTVVSGVTAPIDPVNVAFPVPGSSCSDCAPLTAQIEMLELPPVVSTFKLEPAAS